MVYYCEHWTKPFLMTLGNMNFEKWDAYLFLDQYKINFIINGLCIPYLNIHNNKPPSANDPDII